MRFSISRMLLVLLVLCLSPVPALAIDCIQGRVTEDVNNTCLVDATVTLSQGATVIATQQTHSCVADGGSGFSYVFTSDDGVKCGTTYTVSASAPGYTSTSNSTKTATPSCTEEFTCASADLELHPAPALCPSPSSLSFGDQ
jgi:hypothetical protein